ncbi:Asp-tRNA(Asn)/Glu-tRNA(Gln) amidotransferase subunit GatA, partial [bacterium]|nr:Asp-tRNA(Asn)/Glu-tRNA(Gln) amidotransferase subunit GatA [bacterium]
MELYNKTAHELLKDIKNKKLSAVELTQAVFNRIDKVENKVNAYLYMDKQSALEQAKKIDEKIAKGESVGKLAGIPMAIKDNMCCKGRPVTCASKILIGEKGPYKPPYNATVVDKLIAQDAVIIGSANMDEFAMGSSTENSGIKKTSNPWDLKRVPGGSSGGSAAAVASGEAIIALGSDTGGSIRQPASFCGVVGLKPIYGEVSRYGLIAFASSLDQIGPLTKDVEDAALMMDIIAGHDSMDSTSIRDDEGIYGKYLSSLKNDVKGMKIGLPKECFVQGLDKEVEKVLLDAKKMFESCGAKVVEVSLPHVEYAVAVYYIIATAEASANLARFDGVQYGLRSKDCDDLSKVYFNTRDEGFGKEVKRRIMLGTYVLSSGYYDAYYKKAQKVRTLIKQDYEDIFKTQGIDAILMPTAPSAAF